MKFRKANWKKNFRKVPLLVLEKIRTIESDSIKVECVKRVSKDSIHAGDYKHIGIVYLDDNLSYTNSILPSPTNGLSSKYNTMTKTVIHKNRKKEPRWYSFEAPNFGDWTKGSHEVDRFVRAFPRTILEPLYNSILIDLLDESELFVTFKFSIDRQIKKDDSNFEREVLRDLNLLQENTGSIDVFPSEFPYDQYLSKTLVDWDIFPPGSREDFISHLHLKHPDLSAREEMEIRERYEILTKYCPELIFGVFGLQRYFGAKLREDLVVFENIRYGNAIYILKENWMELSKLSRSELLQKYHDMIIRIVHSKNWKIQLQYQIEKLLS